MNITVKCRAVALSKTKKGSYKIVFVTPEADLFTVYTKDTINTDFMEELQQETYREFSINVSDTPLFFKKGEDEI